MLEKQKVSRFEKDFNVDENGINSPIELATIPDELKKLLKDDVVKPLGGEPEPFANLRTMINSFRDKNKDNTLFNPDDQHNPFTSVTFDKTSILKILSQDFCEGIRFYFSEFNGEPTLTLLGVDIEAKDLIFKKEENGITKIFADDSQHGTKLRYHADEHTLIRLFPYI